MTIVYLGFGNSDDRLRQADWAVFQIQLKQAIHDTGAQIYGEWHSYPDSIYQNACLAFDIEDGKLPETMGLVKAIAIEFQQDAIAWNQVQSTVFLGPAGSTPTHPNSSSWAARNLKDSS